MCGIFGVIGKEDIAESIYFGMTKMQHRGQDAAGIFTYDAAIDRHALHRKRGLVNHLFQTDSCTLPKANWGIGHVRYATIGTGENEETQPFFLSSEHKIAMAHNGNIVNYHSVKKELEEEGVRFESTSDLEVILHTFSRALQSKPATFEAIKQAVKKVQQKMIGSYSVVAIITGVGMVAFRDPHGIRPLLHGVSRDHQSHAFGSETSALNALNFKQIRDVEPGEVIFVDAQKNVMKEKMVHEMAAHCSFEWNYFAKPNTLINNKEVYRVRKELGRLLADKIKSARLPIDAVVPIPTTARSSAITLAESLCVNYEEGFVKQDNVGRVFIMSTQSIRNQALNRKLAAVGSVFRDQSVLLVDDSIVRGTVSKRVIALARQAGAKKVYFASTFPPIRYPCVYGIDFHSQKELIAFDKSVEEVRGEIDADALFFNTQEDLKKAIGSDQICTACISGDYPTCTKAFEAFQEQRAKERNRVELIGKK